MEPKTIVNIIEMPFEQTPYDLCFRFTINVTAYAQYIDPQIYKEISEGAGNDVIKWIADNFTSCYTLFQNASRPISYRHSEDDATLCDELPWAPTHYTMHCSHADATAFKLQFG